MDSIEKHIMVIDDDDDDRELFCKSLNQISEEIDCISEPSGTDALEYLNNPSKPVPDVIFLDINMPVMTGWQFLTTVKHDARIKDIPVIMLSSSSNPREVNIAYDLGADSYCVKPDKPTELKKMLSLIAQNLNGNFKSFLSSNTSQFFQVRTTSGY
ncbi:MAG: rcp1 3 [Bacteroidota bacterium]|jgi:CheY-like chemotaxis protein|nr:rcp1 3 [Bacteroidota bacterium]